MAETLQLAHHEADEPIAASSNGADFRFERAVAPQRVAVIDIGSNSTRMEVLQITADYDLRVVSEVKSLLRLQSRMNSHGLLERSAIEDLKRVVRDFSAVAAASRVGCDPVPLFQRLVGEPPAVEAPPVAVGGMVEGGEGGPVASDGRTGTAVGACHHCDGRRG